MLQDDPIRQQKNDRWKQLTQQGMDPNDAYDAVNKEFAASSFVNRDTAPTIQRPAVESTTVASPAPAEPAKRFEGVEYFKGLARSAGQGFFGVADEAEAAVRSILPSGRPTVTSMITGEPRGYEQIVADIRQKNKDFSEENPKAAFGAEIGTGVLLTGLAGAGRSALARAVSSPVVSGMLSGAGGAEGDIVSRAKGAAVGGVIGKVLGKVLTPTKTASRDVAKDVGTLSTARGGAIATALSDLRNRASTTVDKSQRFVADALENRGFGKAARAIEPVDEKTITRSVKRNLPGTGITEGELANAAEVAGARAGSATQAVSAAEKEAQNIMGETTDRAQRLSVRAVEQGKERAEALLASAKQQAQRVIGGAKQAPGTADAVRESLRTAQKEGARETYAAIAQFGRPEKEPLAVYDAILKSPGLRGVYRAVIRGTREGKVTEKLAKTEGEGLFTPLTGVRMPRVALPKRGGGERNVPALTLETMDEMRQHIRERAAAFATGAETGVSPKTAKKMFSQIDVLENKFLDAYPPEAREAVKAVRAAYREKFVALEALQDGVSMGGIRADKGAKLLSGNPKALTALAVRVRDQYTTPEAREAFQAGGREWFNNLVTDRLDDALTFATSVTKTENGRKKIALVFGKDMVDQMRQIAALADQAGAVKAGAQARAGKIVETGRKMAEKLEPSLATGVSAQKSMADAARLQAEDVAQQLVAARQAKAALAPGGREAAASLVEAGLPSFSPGARAVAQDYGASAVQREIAGMDAASALERLRELSGNPAAKALFGSQLDRTIAELEKRTLGSVARPALAGAAGRRLGGLFTGRDE